MKSVIIKGLSLPEEDGFVDVRVYGDGSAVVPCSMGNCNTYDVEEIDVSEED